MMNERSLYERQPEAPCHARAAGRVTLVGAGANQRVSTGRLDTIAGLAAAGDFKPPCLVIIGEVTALHASLHWFAGADAACAAIG